ncbi:MAG: hypothetical protein FD176_2142 [Rhodospirillaceae bacterium]|nr:MAG: hypothetical protein FD176_2142 [Rhodospirillaceae bacterium]TNC96915.1 MAG: Flagellin [Stygiobacter sp.]
MAGIAPISSDSYALLSGGTVSKVAAAGSAALAVTSQTTSAATAASTAQSAQQSSATINKASENAGKAFEALSALRKELATASQAGSALAQDEITRLDQRVTQVREQINALSTGAQVGSANLLGGTAAAVTVTSAAGDTVRVNSQKLDSKALGLDDLKITDTASLRQAAGQVALASAQAQRVDYNLQVAKSVITPVRTNPGLEAFSQISAALSSTPKAGTALDSVAKAINSQSAANEASAAARAASYGSSTLGFTRSSTRTNTILDLFG